jgi:hypothetical protein
MADEKPIDAQIQRLNSYLFNEKQKRGAAQLFESTDHEIAIEQALALAYIARELETARTEKRQAKL